MLLSRRVRVSWCRPWYHHSISSSSLSLSHLLHPLCVKFQSKDPSSTDLEIIPVRNALDFAIRIVSSNSMDVHDAFSINTDDKKTLWIAKKSVGDTKVQLLLPPHTTKLDVTVANGSVRMHEKIEGHAKVVVGSGDIQVHKVRGQMVKLKTNGGSIHISTLVEGETVQLEASESIQCKKLMADKALVKLGKGSRDSEFGAIYTSTCSITSMDSSGETQLSVGNVHGYLRVASEGLNRVQLDSVTGALDVQDNGDKCQVVAHFDSWTNDSSSSILVGGDVQVSLQPAASIDVELHGTKITVGSECKFLCSEMDPLDDDYVVFTGKLQAQEGAETMASTGKINIESAKDDAMRTSFFMKQSSSDEEDGELNPSRLLVHTLSGEITLDQLNWMENMKRKYLKQ